MRTAFNACLTGLCLLACGGGGDPGPKPLKHHFDDMHIAAVPLGEKQPIIQTQNDYSVAKMEHAKANSDWNESDTKLVVAKNEREQAILAERSASSEKSAADDSSDMTRVNATAVEARRAEMARKAADEKVSWLKAHRAYLKKWVRYTEENMYAKEASYELAKARVAKAKNIKPKGFDFGDYEKQYKDRSERAQRARSVASKEKSHADEKQKKWKSMQAGVKGPPTGDGDGDGGGTP